MSGIHYHPAAQQELIDAACYYESCRPGLGERFRREVERIEQRLLGASDPGVNYHHHTVISRLRRFPYGVVFLRQNDALLVLAVAHLDRRPGYWMHRLRDLH